MLKKRLNIVIPIIIALAVIATAILLKIQEKPAQVLQEPPKEVLGNISTTTNGLLYTNNKFGFSLTYPNNWQVDDNDYETGFLQLFNFEEPTEYKKGFSKNENKIEIGISSSEFYGHSDDYPEKSRTEKTVYIADRSWNRTDLEDLNGLAVRSYNTPIPDSKKFLYIVIYGDPSNFPTLDDVAKSLVWTK